MIETVAINHLIGLKQGRLDSFRHIYRLYYEKVYYFSLSFTKSTLDAEEITADVFAKIWEKRVMIDVNVSLQPLLFKITRDYSWNYLKKTARSKKQREEFYRNYKYATDHGENVIIFGEYQALFDQAIKTLPRQQERVFTLRYLDGKDLNQIAEDLKITKNTVKVHLAKSKRFVLDFLAIHLF